MSRIEIGKRHVSTEDVATICTICELPVAERVELIEFARAGNAAGWWNLALHGPPVDMATLANYESEAVNLTDWSVNLVPGLLQTCEYAVSLMRSVGVPVDLIEARWMARLCRQRILGTVDSTRSLFPQPQARTCSRRCSSRFDQVAIGPNANPCSAGQQVP